MDKKNIHDSLPGEGTNLQLWEVHYKSKYYDDDIRMPSDVPVDERFYVLESRRDKALEKARSAVLEKISGKFSGNYLKEVKENENIEANIVSLENLVVARNSKEDGRLGFHSTQSLKEVQLSLNEDLKKYKLGVCLIPLDD